MLGAQALGQVRERLKRPVSKTGVPVRVPRVRIPPCPSIPVTRTRLPLLFGLVCAVPAARLGAQCPNGSPPPCAREATGAPSTNSVAVLYFTARDTTDAYLADGLTEDVATLLGDVPGVQVQSPSVVRRVQRDSPQDLRAIGRALHVRYLVDGTVRRAGGRLRVSMRLVVAGSGVTTWGELFDRAPEELLALPSVIAREVASRVGASAGSAERPVRSRLRTTSPAAYDHYLRGNFLLTSRSIDGMSRALAEYAEAERLDSSFTAAIGRAAYTYALARASVGLPGVPYDSLAPLGLLVADRALRRDSSSSDAWMARGFLLAYANPKTFRGAMEAFQRAIRLDPNNAEAHHQYAQILSWVGRDAEGEQQLRLALAIDSGRAVSYSDLAFTVRDRAVALRVVDSAVLLEPSSAVFRHRRALVRLWVGDVTGARADEEFAVRLAPGNSRIESTLAIAFAKSGDTTRARRLIPSATSAPLESIYAGAALLAVGDTAAALARLEHAPPDPGSWSLLQWPWFDGLRGNPRFERLVAAVQPVPSHE